MREGIHFVVSGKVQGVSFRMHAQNLAKKLGLTGWVRNLTDGRVEGKAFGDADALLKLKDWLAEGPEFARVNQLELTACEPERYDTFKIALDGDFEGFLK